MLLSFTSGNTSLYSRNTDDVKTPFDLRVAKLITHITSVAYQILSHFFPEVSLRKLTFFNHSSLISKNILSFLSHINTPVSLSQLSGDRPTHTQFSLRCFSCHSFSHFFRIILTFHSYFSSVTKILSPVTYIYTLINQLTLLK